jgi:hypothetical protein
MSDKKPLLLVGDNPFHGVSHLSHERSRTRGNAINQADFAARLVTLAAENGADGFMFTVSGTTLAILEAIRKKEKNRNLRLYAIVPYAYEYVRLATQLGGMSGLGRGVAKRVVFSVNVKAMAHGLDGIVRMDPAALLKTYVLYEISRIKSTVGRNVRLESILLHEIITEMALALDMDWLVKSYIDFTSKLGIKPGFETRNFTYLVDRFRDWNVDFRRVVIATPFNKVGFQMNPSRLECERSLTDLAESNVIAMSILAAGYLKLPEAIEYVRTLTNLGGIVVGVSKEHHSKETFRLLKERLASVE